jgi:hypothetical protein
MLFLSLWLAAVGFILVMVVTRPYGLGTTADSSRYVQAAHSFARGDGFQVFSGQGELVPLTRAPFLYSAVLAAGNYLGIETAEWARMVNAFLFGLNIFLLSLLVYYLTGRRKVSLFAGALGLLFVHLAEAHLFLLPGPLFILLLLLFLGTMIRYIETGKLNILLAAALVAGLAAVTRYVGAALVLTGVLLAALNILRPLSVRFRDTLFFFLASMVIPMVWLVRNIQLTGNVLPYPVELVPGVSAKAGEVILTLSKYLLPVAVGDAVRVVLVFALLLALLFLLSDILKKRTPQDAASRQAIGLKAVLYFTGAYILTAAFGAFFFGRGAVALDTRVLLPVPVAMIVAVPLIIDAAVRGRRKWRGISLRAIVIILFTSSMFLRTAQLAKYSYLEGSGFRSKEWADAELVKTAKTLSDEVSVYSNIPEAFTFLTGRPAIRVPLQGESPAAFLPLDRSLERFRAGHGIVVIFKEKEFLPHPLWWEFSRALPLTVLMRDGWGVIYGASKQKRAEDTPVKP